MKDEDFKKRLSEVADWIIPKTDRETTITAKKKRGRKSNEQQYMELREEIFHQEFDGINPTYPPMLTRVKRCGKNCEDCGAYCPNGRETEAKLHKKGDKKAWRKKCLTCGLYQNPFNGKFELTGSAASIKFNDFMKELKHNAEQKKIIINKKSASTVIENDQEKITFYHENSTNT